MILLDTHAWIWYVDSPGDLSTAARKAIDTARDGLEKVHLSCISSWEIHMLVLKGRLDLSVSSDTWVSRCERLSFLRFHPVDNDIARLAALKCEGMHGDPADRIITATALLLGAKLVTRDGRIHDSGLVDCIW